ncbi:MAG: relaxase domain-containing protein, partial [Acidimicrobiales bacterium]
GGGFRYLIDSVARGDGTTEPSSSLAAYYAESGTPPGVFLGSGLADLDGGKGLEAGSQVSEEHLWNMLVACSDPVSGETVGSLPRRSGSAPVAGFDLCFSPPLCRIRDNGGYAECVIMPNRRHSAAIEPGQRVVTAE